MKLTINKLWLGTKKGLKWVAIQYAVIAGLALLYYLGLCVYSLFVDVTVREVLMRNPLIGHSFYTWQVGVVVAIPIYTLMFGWWNAFFPEQKHWWTYFVPWSVFVAIFFLHVVQGRGWHFKIITVDDYMLGGWLAPLIGLFIHVITRSIYRAP